MPKSVGGKTLQKRPGDARVKSIGFRALGFRDYRGSEEVLKKFVGVPMCPLFLRVLDSLGSLILLGSLIP